MHYYKRHLGDYAKDTGHLSALEHGVYTLLLDWYYANERPIPPDKATRIARGNPEETQTVLSEFFRLSDDGWVHHYADRVIAEYNVKAERNREIGRLGGRPKTQTVPKPNPEETLSTSHKPLTTKEQKQEHTPRPASSIARPDDVTEQVWGDWTDLRKSKKAKVTETALKGIRREAAKAGLSMNEALALCCARGWQGFNADWVAQEARPRGSPAQAQPGKRMQAIMRLEAMKNGLGNSGNNHGDSETLLLGTGPGAGFGTGRGNGSGMG